MLFWLHEHANPSEALRLGKSPAAEATTAVAWTVGVTLRPAVPTLASRCEHSGPFHFQDSESLLRTLKAMQ